MKNLLFIFTVLFASQNMVSSEKQSTTSKRQFINRIKTVTNIGINITLIAGIFDACYNKQLKNHVKAFALGTGFAFLAEKFSSKIIPLEKNSLVIQDFNELRVILHCMQHGILKQMFQTAKQDPTKAGQWLRWGVGTWAGSIFVYAGLNHVQNKEDIKLQRQIPYFNQLLDNQHLRPDDKKYNLVFSSDTQELFDVYQKLYAKSQNKTLSVEEYELLNKIENRYNTKNWLNYLQ